MMMKKHSVGMSDIFLKSCCFLEMSLLESFGKMYEIHPFSVDSGCFLRAGPDCETGRHGVYFNAPYLFSIQLLSSVKFHLQNGDFIYILEDAERRLYQSLQHPERWL